MDRRHFSPSTRTKSVDYAAPLGPAAPSPKCQAGGRMHAWAADAGRARSPGEGAAWEEVCVCVCVFTVPIQFGGLMLGTLRQRQNLLSAALMSACATAQLFPLVVTGFWSQFLNCGGMLALRRCNGL